MKLLGFSALLFVIMGCSKSTFDRQSSPVQSPSEQSPPKQFSPLVPHFQGTGSHGSGGGGTNTAWFPHGNRKISYCIFKGSAAPMRDLLRAAFERGFSIVRDYYLSKGIHHTVPLEKRLATQIEEIEDCGRADLILYPGTEDQDPGLSEFDRLALRTGRANLNNPPSYYFRTDDPRESRTWARGYIWVSPDVTSGDMRFPWRLAPLTGVLGHEMGHLFGIPHIPGTLMSPTFGKELIGLAYEEHVSDQVLFNSYLQMDGSSELYVCETSHCPLQNYHGSLGETATEERAAFEKMVGRSPTGEISARFYFRLLPGYDEFNRRPSKSILWAGSVADELGEHRLFLEVDHNPLELRTGLEIFTNIWNSTPLLFSGKSYQARLHTWQGERLPVQIQRNHMMVNGNGSRLFVGDWEGNTYFTADTHGSLLEKISKPKPDLKIISVNQKNDSSLQVTITNVGKARAWGNNLTARRQGKWVGIVWLSSLNVGQTVNLSLPLTGSDKPLDTSAITVGDLGFGSEKLTLHWNNERVSLFRDQMYLPRATDFDPTNQSPVTVEVDSWNSVHESDEANNLVIWNPRSLASQSLP